MNKGIVDCRGLSGEKVRQDLTVYTLFPDKMNCFPPKVERPPRTNTRRIAADEIRGEVGQVADSSSFSSDLLELFNLELGGILGNHGAPNNEANADFRSVVGARTPQIHVANTGSGPK